MEEYIYDDYYCFKLIQSIIYDISRIDEEMKSDLDFYFEKVPFLDRFQHVVNIAGKQNCIDHDVKMSLLKKFIYIREIQDENTEHRINIINEMIYNLNCLKQDKIFGFYVLEYWKRNYSRLNLKTAFFEFEEFKNAILESICYDIQILYTHSSDMSDEEFLSLVPNFKEDDIYFFSISAIFSEMPEIFKDEIFYKRFKLLCSEFQMDRDDKKLVKKIEKYAK